MEKVTIVVTGYNYGQPRVYAPDQVLYDPESVEDELSITLEPQIYTRSRKASLHIDYGKYVLNLIKDPETAGGKWKVTHVIINLARGLLGHNARLILTESEFQAALTIANETLNQVVTEDSKDLIIPGIAPGSRSYFNYLEIANQIHDPNADILNSWQNARLPYYCPDHLIYKDPKSWGNSESVYIANKAGDTIIGAYRKDKEINKERKVHGNPEHRARWHVADCHRDCTRLEVRLHKRLLINTVLGNSNAYVDGERLVSFRLKDAYEAYERIMRKVRGVFHKTDTNYNGPEYSKDEVLKLTEPYTKKPNLFPLHQVLHEMRDTCSDSKLTKFRDEFEKWLEHSSKVSINDILPHSGTCKTMQIDPLKKQGGELVPVFSGRPTSFLVDPRIASAYSGLNTLNLSDLDGLGFPWLEDGKWQH